MLQSIKRQSGFTLLELIVCLFIITLAVGLSTVQLASLQPSEQLKSTARDIATTIRQAKNLAKVTGQRQVFVVDIDNRTFNIEGKGKRPIPPMARVTIDDPLHGTVARGLYRVEFYPSGLSGTANITLETGTKVIEIRLDPIVGASVVKS